MANFGGNVVKFGKVGNFRQNCRLAIDLFWTNVVDFGMNFSVIPGQLTKCTQFSMSQKCSSFEHQHQVRCGLMGS